MILRPGLTYVQLFLHSAGDATAAGDSEGARTFVGTTDPIGGRPKKQDLDIIKARNRRSSDAPQRRASNVVRDVVNVTGFDPSWPNSSQANLRQY